MEQKAENTYSNVIAPSDGVRRFLCKSSVLFMGIIALAYSVCAFRMNSLEHSFSGGSLRTTMLYIAYIIFPLGVLGAAICARIKQCGLAYSMIALLVADVGSFMLFLNSLSAFLRESNLQGYLGGALELAAFTAVLAILVNLTLSCMNCRLLPVFGNIGTIVSVLALIITGVRVAITYSSMQFAWNSEFDWSNLASQVSGENLHYQAKWIFRCITLGSFEAEEMFMLRFCERIAACLLYVAFIVFCAKYKNSMKNFNKLLSHASEYVEIPQANIAESIAETEKIIGEKLKSGTQSVKDRLKNMKKSGKEDDLPELFDPLNNSENPAEFEQSDYPQKRRRPENMTEEEMRERARRRRPENMTEEEMRERARRRRPENMTEEEMRERARRRRPENMTEEEMRERARRRRPENMTEEEMRERARRRRPENMTEEEMRERARRRRPENMTEEDMRERARRREEAMTDEERYLLEERRRRNPNYDEEGRRQANRGRQLSDEERARRARQARRRAENANTSTPDLNDYYNNYMSRRRDEQNNRGDNN